MADITPEDSSPIELVPTAPNVDLTIHTGTSFRIREGTFADYHSQEQAQDTIGGTSADIYAIEGEWKICEQNENNLFVADVASFPIARCVQYCGSDDNATYNTLEFPHHHMTPHLLSGTSSMWFSAGASYKIYGLTTHGDYAYWHEFYDYNNRAIRRKSMISGEESVLTRDTLIGLGHGFGDLEFAVIDDNTVMFIVEDTGGYGYYKDFATWNFATSTFTLICSPDRNPYGTYTGWWHWGIIGHKLYMSGWNYVLKDGFTQYVGYINHIFDITNPGGGPLVTLITPLYLPHGNMQYPVCNDLIIQKKALVEYHTAYSETPGYDDRPRLFVFDTENNTISIVHPIYGDGGNYMYHLCENPFNQMLYYIAYRQDAPSNYYSIQIMSPDNYSNGTYYEYIYAGTPSYGSVPAVLIPGMFELYVLMANGDIYNVRDMNTILCHLTTTWEGITVGENEFGDYIDMPQPSKFASCLDRWDRLWYVDGSYIKTINFTNGELEISMEAGIYNVWRGFYNFPYFNRGFQHVYLARDRVLVLCHKDFDGVHTDTTSYIFKIE